MDSFLRGMGAGKVVAVPKGETAVRTESNSATGQA